MFEVKMFMVVPVEPVPESLAVNAGRHAWCGPLRLLLAVRRAHRLRRDKKERRKSRVRLRDLRRGGFVRSRHSKLAQFVRAPSEPEFLIALLFMWITGHFDLETWTTYRTLKILWIFIFSFFQIFSIEWMYISALTVHTHTYTYNTYIQIQFSYCVLFLSLHIHTRTFSIRGFNCHY